MILHKNQDQLCCSDDYEDPKGSKQKISRAEVQASAVVSEKPTEPMQLQQPPKPQVGQYSKESGKKCDP